MPPHHLLDTTALRIFNQSRKETPICEEASSLFAREIFWRWEAIHSGGHIPQGPPKFAPIRSSSNHDHTCTIDPTVPSLNNILSEPLQTALLPLSRQEALFQTPKPLPRFHIFTNPLDEPPSQISLIPPFTYKEQISGIRTDSGLAGWLATGRQAPFIDPGTRSLHTAER